MDRTPNALRLHLGIFGRSNVGKSSLLNYIASQDVSITSPWAGTTTDVVQKTMELAPLGPVVFLDTAGLDDRTALAPARQQRAYAAMDRTDIALLVTEPGVWSSDEEEVVRRMEEDKVPVLVLINKSDLGRDTAMEQELERRGLSWVRVSSLDTPGRERFMTELKRKLITLCPEEKLQAPPLVGDLVRPGGLVVMVVPIDLQAPKGRLILPQVQAIRDLLDSDAMALVVKEREYRYALERLKEPPELVVCDSSVVLKTIADTPPDVPCTTFSILFARLKSDLAEMARGARAIEGLKNGDRVLVAEACSHHAVEDDIGRVKIPRWLKQFTGLNLDVQVYAGHDYPQDLGQYQLVIHCGSCMLNRRAMLSRLAAAKEAGVPITNYGVCISYVQGVLPRVLSPFGLDGEAACTPTPSQGVYR